MARERASKTSPISSSSLLTGLSQASKALHNSSPPPTHTMMLSGKLSVIFCAVLAIAVNGSPVEVERRDQTVRTLRVTDEIQTLIVPSTLSQIKFCVDPGSSGACSTLPLNNNACVNAPSGFDNDISSFTFDQGISCTLFEYVNSPAATDSLSDA